MLRLTVVAQTPTEAVLQVEGWVASEDVPLLAEEGDLLLVGSHRLVLELAGLAFIDADGVGVLARWARLDDPRAEPRLLLRDGSPFIRRLLERHGLHCTLTGDAEG